ncbi:helix-turn-helix domain-containing protein [Paenibacillus sacheonensis]|uniref:AraC family transcriptional regulator n=1 Tax=Paenibacillus sacheonensis TaxID=742054 RepID=A0A7X4YPT9_9BACL|nr:helix-turn-helix domain-containing protein [Paenibacillus sacheonensis]MBM7564923.1 AraC-like DNA-binding protein [Paenibacillus sacheonensis]NBC70288.1 AraC family transcriptional regulator [Paenibacillus sacheonensis]
MLRREHSWNDHPILPYVRLCYRFVSQPFFQGERRLLDYLFLSMEKGRYILTVEGADYELNEGEFALIQPGVLFTTRGFGDCVVPNAHLDFFYNPARAQSFVTTPGQANIAPYAHLLQPRLNDFPEVDIPVLLRAKQPQLYRDTLLQMIEQFKRNDIPSTLKVQQLALELLQLLLGSGGGGAASYDFEGLQFVRKMNAFLSFNLSAPLSVEEMAKHAGYSESHFSTVFGHHFGTTPHQYLLRLRLQKAQELLGTTTLKLEQVAAYCGFASDSHLSKAFKRQTGLSPREFRAGDRRGALRENGEGVPGMD